MPHIGTDLPSSSFFVRMTKLLLKTITETTDPDLLNVVRHPQHDGDDIIMITVKQSALNRILTRGQLNIQRQSKITEETEEAIRTMLDDGIPIKDIAKLAKVSRPKVYQVKSQLEKSRKRNVIPPKGSE